MHIKDMPLNRLPIPSAQRPMPGHPMPQPRPMPQRAPQQPVPQTHTAVPQGRKSGGGPMGFITDNYQAFLQLGAGLSAGRTPGEQMALGAQGFGVAVEDITGKREEKQRKNQTIEWLKINGDPDIIEALEMGAMKPSEAFQAQWQRKADARKGSEFTEQGLSTTGSINQKYRALLAQGVSEADAMAVASGRFHLSMDPNTGNRALVDMVTGEMRPVTMVSDVQRHGNPQIEQVAGNPQNQDGLYDRIDDATGVGTSLANAATNTIGQVPGALGDAFTFEDQASASAEFQLLQRDLIRSLSLNPRFPVAEQRRIESLLPRGAFTSPEMLRQSVTALDRELARMETDLSASANNPNTPIQQRQQDAQTLSAIGITRQRLGVPQGGGSAMGDQPSKEQLKQRYGLD